MQHLQAIEGNSLAAEEIAMFEMFEREGWSFKRRHKYITALFDGRAFQRHGRDKPGHDARLLERFTF